MASRLQARIERGHDAMPRGILRAQRLEQVRREIGQVVRLGGQRLAQRQIEVERVRSPASCRRRSSEVALGLQALAIARQMHQRRVVRQHRQRRGLRPRQRRRIAAEVAPRGGLEADHVAAEGRMRRVQREDLVLVVGRLEAQREQRLGDLGAESARRSRAARAVAPAAW